MAGVRLEAKIHIVTGAVTSAHNIVKCANRSGLDVCDIVLESLASGEAVLTNEEKELGTALLDLGGGTSDLAIFSGKNIRHTFVLSLGGNNLTNDIAIGLRAPLVEAEKIKTRYGTCSSHSISNDYILCIHIDREQQIWVGSRGGLDKLDPATGHAIRYLPTLKKNLDVKELIHIISIYQDADDKILEKAMITEPFGYLIKPFKDQELRLNIEMALYKHKLDLEKENLILELRTALDRLKTLSGLLPICSKCKKIRNDDGYWEQIETYISEHSDAEFTHGMCHDCMEETYARQDWYQRMKDKKDAQSRD